MYNKPEIIFTFPGCLGGVSSFNFNIINNSLLIKQFHSKVILIKAAEDKRPLFLESFNVDETIIFNFSYKENQYYVKKRLNQLLGKTKGAIVTDNALTITAARLFDNPKTIFHLIHDYYYVNQNIQMGNLVDVAIAHSSFFSDAVFAANPNYFNNSSFYIPYGVQQVKVLPLKQNEVLNVVFLGRLDSSKGVALLHEIDAKLEHTNVKVNWNIIGKGSLKDALHQQWASNSNVTFYEPDSTSGVYELLQKQDIFVFPTSFEGTPVSILECLANGVVTITNDLPGGIRDIIKQGIGFRCDLNDLNEFVNYIVTLNSDRTLLAKMQQKCFELANEKYDIKKNADKYFDVFLKYRQFKRLVKTKASNMSRFDKPLLPNWFVIFFRSIRGIF
jgi:glycosyltransferase involved in cell wall biosynthesis